MRRVSAMACWALLLLVAVAACAGGIDREQAVEIALREGGASDATVIRAERGPLVRFTLGRTQPDAPQDRDAWAITLSGSFPGECVVDAAGESMCPPMARTKLVVLDAATGAFLFGETPAP